jgi:hypothetical protein
MCQNCQEDQVEAMLQAVDRGKGHCPAGSGLGEEVEGWQAQWRWQAYRSSCSRRGEALWRILLWASA